MISLSKPRYSCELVGWYQPNVIGYPDHIRAVIIRKDNHAKLGPPNGKATITSLVLRIDVPHQLIETLNSVYSYGG